METLILLALLWLKHSLVCLLSYLRFIVPDAAATSCCQVCVVASFASVAAVGVIPDLLFDRGHQTDGETHPGITTRWCNTESFILASRNALQAVHDTVNPLHLAATPGHYLCDLDLVHTLKFASIMKKISFKYCVHVHVLQVHWASLKIEKCKGAGQNWRGLQFL